MAQESWKREKDETDCKIPEALILCVNNCGVFGSPATLNMCSKCYNESLLKKPNSPPSSSSPPAPPPQPSPPLHSSSPTPTPPQTPPSSSLQSLSAASPCSSSPSSSLSSPSQPSTSAIVTPEKANQKLESAPQDRPLKTVSAVFRCSSCQRKVGLTGFRCRCGELFCARHRYSDTHNCSYDYKAAGREAIARENPVVKAAKIIKI